MHPRSRIRQAVVAALLGKTGAGSRVFASRTRPLASRQLPAIGVYALSEEADHQRTSPRTYERILQLAVDVITWEDAGLDAALDQLCVEIEAVLLPDPTLGGACEDFTYRRAEINLLPAQSSDPGKGAALLVFEATYSTDQPTPSLDDFRTAVAGWDLAPEPDGVPEAVDTITLPQPDEEEA
ncbi:MAG: hypothetical protein V3573_06740 [Desulfovibrionaceae bacterium]